MIIIYGLKKSTYLKRVKLVLFRKKKKKFSNMSAQRTVKWHFIWCYSYIVDRYRKYRKRLTFTYLYTIHIVYISFRCWRVYLWFIHILIRGNKIRKGPRLNKHTIHKSVHAVLFAYKNSFFRSCNVSIAAVVKHATHNSRHRYAYKISRVLFQKINKYM